MYSIVYGHDTWAISFHRSVSVYFKVPQNCSVSYLCKYVWVVFIPICSSFLLNLQIFQRGYWPTLSFRVLYSVAPNTVCCKTVNCFQKFISESEFWGQHKLSLCLLKLAIVGRVQREWKPQFQVLFLQYTTSDRHGVCLPKLVRRVQSIDYVRLWGDYLDSVSAFYLFHLILSSF